MRESALAGATAPEVSLLDSEEVEVLHLRNDASTFFLSLAEEALLGLFPNGPAVVVPIDIVLANADEAFPASDLVKRGDLLGDVPRLEFAKGHFRSLHRILSRAAKCRP